MTYNEGLAALALRGKWARGCLWLYVVISLLGIPIGLGTEYAYYESGVSLQVLGIMSIAYSLISLVASFGCILTVPLWTHRAWANLRMLGLRGLGYSPAWAAGSYFVPIVGLVVPFRAMRELHNRSSGESEDFAHESVGDVTSWWACYIAGILVVSFLVVTSLFNTNGSVFITTPRIMTQALSIFGNLLLTGGAWFLIRTIRDITSAQSASAGISETFA